MQKQKEFKIIDKVSTNKKSTLKSLFVDQKQIMALRFDNQDNLLASATSDGKIKIYNAYYNTKISQLSTNSQNQSTPTIAIRWKPKQTKSILLAANSSGGLYQYFAKSAIKIWQTKQNHFINAIDYDLNGDKFATAGQDCIVKIYDESKKCIVNQLKGIQWCKVGHNNRLFSLKFNPDDPNIIISGGWDKNIHIWDIRNNQCIKTILGPNISGDAIDMNGGCILTGAHRSNNQLQLWDYSTAKLIKTFQWDQKQKQNNGFIFSCQFNKLKEQTIIASGGNSVKLFNKNQEKQSILEVRIREDLSIYTVDFANNSNKFIMGTTSGMSYYININGNK